MKGGMSVFVVGDMREGTGRSFATLRMTDVGNSGLGRCL
jgi:hypothetical protein